MKKQLLLLVSTFFCLSNVVAQQLIVEKKWEFSQTEENIPSWIGATTERSMALYDGKLYIPSRNGGGNKLVIVDTEDGSHSILNLTGVAAGTIAGNTIGITSDGNVLLGNGGGKGFVIQLVDLTTGVASAFFTSDAANVTAGRVDGWAVYGTLNDGYIVVPVSPLSGAGGLEVLVFNLENGSVANPTSPDRITTVNGTGASAFTVDSESFYTFSQNNIPRLFTKGETGWALASEQFTGTVKPGNAGSSGGEVTYEGHRIFASSKDRYANLQIFDITSGLSQATTLFSAEAALGTTQNTAMTAPICTEVKSDGAYIYMMGTNNGIAAYQISTEGGVGIKDATVQDYTSLQNSPNPAKSITNITYKLAESAQVELAVWDITGRKIATLVNEKQGEGEYSIPFDVNSLNDGIYIYQLTTGNQIVAKKMIVKK